MWMMKRRGLRMEPWGTPQIILFNLNVQLPMDTEKGIF